MVAIDKNMICGSIATISIVVISFFWLRPVWFWTSLEIIGGLLVAAGCWGEWFLFHNPASEDDSKKLAHRSLELRCIIVVAIGVSLEFASSGHSILEGIRLESMVEDLRKANNEFEAERKPRTISKKQTDDFISLTKLIPKIPINIEISHRGSDTVLYAAEIRTMLHSAHFGDGNVDGFYEDGRFENGVVSAIGYESDPPGIYFFCPSNFFKESHTFVFQAKNDSNTPLKIKYSDPRANNRAIYEALSIAFNEIGITNKWLKASWLPDGAFEIFVDHKVE